MQFKKWLWNIDRESWRGEKFLFEIMNGCSVNYYATPFFLSFNIFGSKNWFCEKVNNFSSFSRKY
jgi:hypothetical protein